MIPNRPKYPEFSYLVQYTYDELFTYENIYHFALQSEAGVRWKLSVQNFMLDRPIIVSKLYNIMKNREYQSAGFNKFTTHERGKVRDIHSVHITERVIQKVLSYALRWTIIPRLLYSNCASIPGRGTQFAIDLFRRDLVYAYRNFGPNCPMIIADYHSFYNSIPHALLIDMLSQWIEDKEIFDLAVYFISNFSQIHNPNQECFNNKIKTICPTNGSLIKPENVVMDDYIVEYNNYGIYDPKFIITAGDYDILNLNPYISDKLELNFGLGLGSEISQIAGVAYTNKIDHTLKEYFQIAAYTKYMDDCYLIDPDIVKLREAFAYMQEESARLGLAYNHKHTNFYHIGDHYTFLKKRTTITNTGKILMKIADSAIRKHRHTFKAQKRLLEQGRISMDAIFQSFYGWRQSNAQFDSRNSLKQLTAEFIECFNGLLNKEQITKLYIL